MTILVVGASGATGSLVVQQLLAHLQPKNRTVKIIIRSNIALSQVLPMEIIQDSRLEIIEASLLKMTNSELLDHVKNCKVVISCLGHNLTLQGIYGQPYRLVADTVKRLCTVINKRASEEEHPPVKFILMNSAGNQNKQDGEKISRLQAMALSLIRALVPPHADNEDAAFYLQNHIGKQHKNITWVSVRPDSLTDELYITDYDTYVSPIRSAIFDSGKTSRANVAHFIAKLALNEDVWNTWRSQMPVIYNRASAAERGYSAHNIKK